MQFKDIKGQRALLNDISQVIDSGRVSHAQMLLGDSKSGSLAIAIAYLQYLCCTDRQHYRQAGDGYVMPDGTSTELRADSCGTCPSCRKFAELSHSDLHFFFPNAANESVKKNPSSADFMPDFMSFLNTTGQYGTLEEWYSLLGIENKQGLVREKDADDIVNVLAMKPYEGNYKMVVVWCAEKLNLSAANTMLKSLEEPSGKTVIFLVCESDERVLPTIISRVQKIIVPPLAQQAAGSNDEFAAWFVEWMRMLFKLNMAQLSAWVDRIAKIGREPQKQFLNYCLEALRQCFLRSASGLSASYDFGDAKFNSSFFAVVTINNIAPMNEALNEALMSIERNANPSITFMNLSFQLSKWIKKR